MSARVKSAVLVACITLMATALSGCGPTSSPAAEREAAIPAATVVAATAASPSPTVTAALVATARPEPTAAVTTVAATPSATPEPTVTTAPVVVTPTATPEPTATAAPVVTPTASPEPTATAAPPVSTPTATPQPTATVAAESEADAPLAFDPLVTRGTLSNGLVYYIRHNEEPRERAQLSLIVKTGSILEEGRRARSRTLR